MAEQHVAPVAIEIAAGTPDALRALLSSVPTETLGAKLDGDWSAKDVVAHLLDVEQVAFSDRIRRMINEDRPLITPIEPSERLDERGYASWSFEKLLDAFDEKRADNVALLRGLSAEQLDRLADHVEAGEISVFNLAHYCSVHDMMHLQQIAKMLQTALAPKTGNMRRYIEE